jgi:uncharacterized protein
LKKTVFILFLCLSIFAQGYSQTKQESIRELFTVMKNDSVTKKIFESIVTAYDVKKHVNEMDSTKNAEFRVNESRQMLKLKIIKEKLDDEMVTEYEKYFTQQEINQLITFYKSPIGKKYANVRPMITKDIIVKVMKYMESREKSKE